MTRHNFYVYVYVFSFNCFDKSLGILLSLKIGQKKFQMYCSVNNVHCVYPHGSYALAQWHISKSLGKVSLIMVNYFSC